MTFFNKELPLVHEPSHSVRELMQYTLDDLSANVACFNSLLLASAEGFSSTSLLGISLRQTLEFAIWDNFSYLALLEYLSPDEQEQSVKTLRALESASETDLIQLYQQSTEQVSHYFRAHPQDLMNKFPNPQFEEELHILGPAVSGTVSGLECLLKFDGGLTKVTGNLLKHIDALRVQGYYIERPRELSKIWGGEEAQPHSDATQGFWILSEATRSLLRKPRHTTMGELREQMILTQSGYEFPPDILLVAGYDPLPEISDKEIEAICKHTVAMALDNHRFYEYLAFFRRDDSDRTEICIPIGNGSTPEEDLRHEVVNLFNRLHVLRPNDPQIPPTVDLARISVTELLDVYLKGAYLLGEYYTDTTLASQTFNWWGPKTGSQILLTAYRHMAQHSGTLGMHYTYRKDFLY